MDYRTLGSTGMRVSPLCLGAMMFGAWGDPDHDESVRIIHRGLDSGLNFIDPAEGDPNQRGNSRRRVTREVEASLRRLQTDWIDLYQVHRPDPTTDDDETLAVRGIERDVLPVAEQYRMGVLPWSPLAGGWLTGRFRNRQEAPQTNRAKMMPGRFDLSEPSNQARLDAVDDLAVLAEKSGLSLVHLALAFVMQHPAVTAPIIGPRTMHQLAPGTNVGDGGNAYGSEALDDPLLRRRR